jgi:hypothetical protein
MTVLSPSLLSRRPVANLADSQLLLSLRFT